MCTNLEHKYCQTRSEQLSIISSARPMTEETQRASKELKGAQKWDNCNIGCLHTNILGDRNTYSFGSFFNPRKIPNVQVIQKNTHIITCPYCYWCVIAFTFIIHWINNKYFKPGSQHQLYKFLGYLHSFIKRMAKVTVTPGVFLYFLHVNFCSYKAISSSFKHIMWLLF